YLSDRPLQFLGIFMLLSLPSAYRTARIAGEMKRDFVADPTVPPPLDDSIPNPIAQQIITRLKSSTARQLPAKVLAQQTLTIYETLATRTPGWGATIGFSLLHGASFVIALVLLIALVVGQREDFSKIANRARYAPRHSVSVA